MGNFSYVHNIIVMSNKIDDLQGYFQKVLGADIENFQIDNIAATNAFKYYSMESLGVITEIASGNEDNILYD